MWHTRGPTKLHTGRETNAGVVATHLGGHPRTTLPPLSRQVWPASVGRVWTSRWLGSAPSWNNSTPHRAPCATSFHSWDDRSKDPSGGDWRVRWERRGGLVRRTRLNVERGEHLLQLKYVYQPNVYGHRWSQCQRWMVTFVPAHCIERPSFDRFDRQEPLFTAFLTGFGIGMPFCSFRPCDIDERSERTVEMGQIAVCSHMKWPASCVTTAISHTYNSAGLARKYGPAMS